MTEPQKKFFFLHQFKRSWLTQGLNGSPLYLSMAAESGHRMKKYLGFNYSPFLFYYKNDYAEGSYAAPDFPKFWPLVRSHIRHDGKYLEKMRRRYDSIFASYKIWRQTVRRADLTKQSDDWLEKNLRRAGEGLADSIGLAHVIEIIGWGLEADFKARLNEKYGDFSPNKLLAGVSGLYKPSFINREEQALRRIGSTAAAKSARPRRLAAHAARYYWFNTNYIGSHPADPEYFAKRLKSLKPREEAVTTRFVLPPLLRPDQEIRQLINLIRFTADWQDERKVNIFKAVYHAEILVRELSRRSDIPLSHLRYMAVEEIMKFRKKRDWQKYRKILAVRRQGCFQWLSGTREIIVAGAAFRSLEKYYHSIRSHVGSVPLSIEGTTANSGRVVGPVVICRSTKDLNKVRSGDVLVASMTRPEYLSGIKKAAALVTDEGGITCHAAIVSRELGLPCIIGTKIATKALRDGDVVEVNANHGVVKILRNNH